MSIYGPEPPEAELATGPDNHALKARLGAQVGLRVLKAGDTMTGELQMGGNMIRGLPQVYPPSDYLGDEAISWSQVVRLLREALEAWEASRSPIEPSPTPLITVWAEENGALDGGYEWSFGNGSNQHATLGFAMPTPGRGQGQFHEEVGCTMSCVFLWNTWTLACYCACGNANGRNDPPPWSPPKQQ